MRLNSQYIKKPSPSLSPSYSFPKRKSNLTKNQLKLKNYSPQFFLNSTKNNSQFDFRSHSYRYFSSQIHEEIIQKIGSSTRDAVQYMKKTPLSQKELIEIFNLMKKGDFIFNSATLNCLLFQLQNSKQDHEEGQREDYAIEDIILKIFSQVSSLLKKSDFIVHPNDLTLIYLSVIIGQLGRGNITQALDIFDGMLSSKIPRNVKIYKRLIHRLIDLEDSRAFTVFQIMKDEESKEFIESERKLLFRVKSFAKRVRNQHICFEIDHILENQKPIHKTSINYIKGTITHTEDTTQDNYSNSYYYYYNDDDDERKKEIKEEDENEENEDNEITDETLLNDPDLFLQHIIDPGILFSEDKVLSSLLERALNNRDIEVSPKIMELTLSYVARKLRPAQDQKPRSKEIHQTSNSSSSSSYLNHFHNYETRPLNKKYNNKRSVSSVSLKSCQHILYQTIDLMAKHKMSINSRAAEHAIKTFLLTSPLVTTMDVFVFLHSLEKRCHAKIRAWHLRNITVFFCELNDGYNVRLFLRKTQEALQKEPPPDKTDPYPVSQFESKREFEARERRKYTYMYSVAIPFLSLNEAAESVQHLHAMGAVITSSVLRAFLITGSKYAAQDNSHLDFVLKMIHQLVDKAEYIGLRELKMILDLLRSHRIPLRDDLGQKVVRIARERAHQLGSLSRLHPEFLESLLLCCDNFEEAQHFWPSMLERGNYRPSTQVCIHLLGMCTDTQAIHLYRDMTSLGVKDDQVRKAMLQSVEQSESNDSHKKGINLFKQKTKKTIK